MSSQELDSLKGGALELLAMSFLEMFPDADLKGGKVTSWGFYYDFKLNRPFSSEFLTFLEETMRQKSKKNFSIQVSEMMASNASSYFASLGRKDLENRALKEEGLVSIVQIGPFLDICSSFLPSTLSSVSHFKLLEFFSLSEGIRVVGVAAPDKESLKKFLKNWDGLKKKDHLYQIEKRQLLRSTEEGWIWLSSGEEFRNTLNSLWRQTLKANGFFPISTPSHSMEALIDFHTTLLRESEKPTAEISFLPLGQEEQEEGLLETFYGFVDNFFLSYSPKELLEKLILSLQMILKIIKICDFKYELMLSFTGGKSSIKEVLEQASKAIGIQPIRQKTKENGFYFWIEDILGRKWMLSFLEVDLQKKIIRGSVFYSQERFLALLIEQNKENTLLNNFASLRGEF